MRRLRDPAVLRRLGLVLSGLGIALVVISIVGLLLDRGDDVPAAVQASPATEPAPTTTSPPPTAETTSTTAIDEMAARLTWARAFAGTYTGEWRNLTFGSTGSIETEVILDENARTLTLTTDLGGSVFGGNDPDPETFIIDLTAGTELRQTSPLFGDVTVKIDSDGRVVVVGEDTPAPGIARIELTGRVDPVEMGLEYVIDFEDGGTAEGIVSLARSTETVAAAPSGSTVEEFMAQLATALREGDEAFLFPRLHPAVLELYGEEQCRAYTTPLQDPTLQLEVRGVTGPERWAWERDDRTTDVADVFTVAVLLRSGDTEADQELHVGIVAGDLRWFTDCGDPLP